MKKGEIGMVMLVLLFLWLITRPLERNKKNADKLKDLDPHYQNRFRNFMNDIRKLGYEPRITSGVRTFEEQHKAHLKDKRNPEAGNTSHETGIAIDMILISPSGKVINSRTSKKVWQTTGVPDLAINRYKMRWGGNFKNYYDPVHFDYLRLS